MKNPAFALAAALLLATTAASAQSFASFSGQPLGRARAATAELPARPYATRYLAGGGSVSYFEAVPTCDAQHEQFAQLRQAFATSKPTLVLSQWPTAGFDSTETATIARLGAGGYTCFLAHQLGGMPTQRFADPVAEYEYLRARIAAEPLKLYYLLQQVQRLRDQTGADKAGLQLAMQALIARSAAFLPGTEQVIGTLPALEAAYRRYCPAGSKWWELPASFFTPDAPASQTGPALAAINQALGDYRTQQLQRLATAPARAGQRVLVVAAPGYLPAALRQAGPVAHN